jgi:glycosyltransferase involved in cell wall biosynthesis
VPLIALDQALDLANRGCFVTIASATSGELAKVYKDEKIPVLIDPLVLESPQSIEKFLANFDLIQANTILAWRLVLIAKSLNIPVLWVIQEGDFGVNLAQENKGIQKALAIADRVVFSSRQTLMKYSTFGNGANFSSMFFGVEEPSGYVRSQTKNNKENLRIIHIGSIEERKGQDILIGAVKRLPQNIKEQIEVLFIGRILQRGFYELQRSESLNLSNIHWMGQLPRDQVWRHLDESDILVCSSRDETGPLVVYQAMSLGKTVVATPVGAVPEIIQHNKNGIVFPLEDTVELSNILVELVTNRELLEKLGSEALVTYNNKLTKQSSNENIYKIIQAILK